MGHHGTASAVVEAPPDDVFAAITDIDRLPEWNTAIQAVNDRPAALSPGSQWVITMHALGSTWDSRSELLELDREGRTFAYRSVTDDGNPSFAKWRWTVEPVEGGSRVTVSYDLNPRTFWRKYLLVYLRKPALRKELKMSLKALSNMVHAR